MHPHHWITALSLETKWCWRINVFMISNQVFSMYVTQCCATVWSTNFCFVCRYLGHNQLPGLTAAQLRGLPYIGTLWVDCYGHSVRIVIVSLDVFVLSPTPSGMIVFYLFIDSYLEHVHIFSLCGSVVTSDVGTRDWPSRLLKKNVMGLDRTLNPVTGCYDLQRCTIQQLVRQWYWSQCLCEQYPVPKRTVSPAHTVDRIFAYCFLVCVLMHM